MNFEKRNSCNYDITFNRKIKYIIIHYTGMKNQKLAIKRLQSRVAKVSAHYLISKRGKIFQMVDDSNIAWHAGVSRWGGDINLNSKSIGIELVNNGDETFPKIQIKSLSRLIKILKKKYRIKKENILGHSDIAPERKKDPGPLFPWNYLAKIGLTKKS